MTRSIVRLKTIDRKEENHQKAPLSTGAVHVYALLGPV